MLHSPTMPSARYSSWHLFFISTGHKTARTHIHPHVVGCELEYAIEALFLARYQSADERNALHPHVSHVVVAEVWGSRLR